MNSALDLLTFALRPRRRTAVFLIAVIWISIVVLLFQNYNRLGFQQVEGAAYDGQIRVSTATQEKEAYAKVKETILDNLSIQMYQKQNQITDSRKIVAHSSVYDIIFANHDVNSVLASLNFEQRCDLYFTTLYTNSNNWYLDPDKDLPLDDRDEFKYEDYKRKKTKELKEDMSRGKAIEADEVKEDAIFEERMKIKYSQFWMKTQRTEQTIVDYLSHLRIFNKCYVTRDNIMERNSIEEFVKNQSKYITMLSEASTQQTDALLNHHQGGSLKFIPTQKERLLNTDSFVSCSNLEGRLYPWLSFSYPIYERWTKEISFLPPNMKKYKQHPIVFEPSHSEAHKGKGKAGKLKSKLTKNSNCFLTNFKNSLNGKGIVLSIADGHVDDTIRLVHLLRALNNKYPIEIVYNDGLSESNKDRIRTAAREPFSSLPSSFETVRKYFPKDYLDRKDGGLPKQEIWFVNVHNVIQDKYKGKFNGFGNKFLAAMFNSFEEYMLIDADSVLVQNPDYFFKLKNYQELGAYFYKDRTAPHFRPESDSTFFKKITPSVLDQVMFNIPIILKETFQKYEFFAGMFYYMESGLVMINRNLHFNSIMMMIQMNFLHTVNARVYGDKEIFFLAFLAAGEENFHFNKFYAAAIGVETPMSDRMNDKHPKPLISKEICGAHPGHIDGEDGKSLAWFNSGYRFCGQSNVVDYEKEFKEGRRFKDLSSVDEMKHLFKNPAVIRHAIVPPFKNKLETLCENKIGEPKEAWTMDTGYCNSYLWCAYDRIGGPTEQGGDSTQLGEFIEFDQKSVDLFKYYGDIWVGNE